MRGDVSVLRRQERQTRRADRVQKRLQKRLRKKYGAVAAMYAERAPFRLREEAVGLPPHGAVGRSRRRILRSCNDDRRRTFFCASFGETLADAGVGVVVAPANAEATAQEAVDCALKLGKGSYPINLEEAHAFPLLLSVDDSNGAVDCPRFGSPTESGRIMCSTVFFPESAPLFFLVGDTTCSSVCTASDTGLDEGQFHSLQTAALKMLGVVEKSRL